MANNLLNASSLYLQQHAHNPVNWYPWSNEAFERAKKENKPVLVSIGYAACHWCHVMERESFEDESVADYMNEHFINIKVDREEHPDVDHMYMDALLAMQQSGGWPLNVFVTPERKPFYGGTYFPPKSLYHRASWMQTLEAIVATWNLKREELALQADQLLLHLKQLSAIESPTFHYFDKSFIDNVITNLNRYSDSVYGGFSNAPKFPAFGCIQLLLDAGFFKKEDSLIDQGIFHLDQILKGGIYDQIGGGIARYATDIEWLVPHFEKMLYDNAQLISTLSRAIQLKNQSYHKDKLIETIDFVLNNLAYNGAFATALDADTEGEEGKYYIWNYDTIASLVLHPAMIEFWDISETGNWEGSIILRENTLKNDLLLKYGLTEAQWGSIYLESKNLLLEIRNKRALPKLDNKIITSQNAMLAGAFIDAYRAIKDEAYLTYAVAIIQHLKINCFKDGQLLHQDSRQNTIMAKLDDYAWLIKALLMLGQHFDNRQEDLNLAVSLMQVVLTDFSDEEHRFFYFSSVKQSDILVRKSETYDGAQPSSNAIIMEQLVLLGNLTSNYDWIERAEHMALSMQQQVMKYPTSFSRWAINTQYLINGWKINLVNGAKSFAMIKEMLFIFMPNLYSIAGVSIPNSIKEITMEDLESSDCTALICEKGICNLPTKDIFKIFE